MTETLKVIRIFLASPGDLADERRAAKIVVDEINDILGADGYHVELMGWEDTIAAYGRPQAIINQDLERCGLFVGMMFKYWGTPPDMEGPYTSGFEEEFSRSMIRREATGQPDIKLFFKEIDKDGLKDVGPSLRKVLDFKEKIITEKKLLFQPFKDVRDLESKLRKCIFAHIRALTTSEQTSANSADSARIQKADDLAAQETDPAPLHSALSPEGQRFLQQFASKVAIDEELSAVTSLEVARFRLLGSSISKPGNDEEYLGVHDANLIYLYRNEVTLGSREIAALLRCGLRYLEDENVPFWHWLTQQKSLDPNFLAFTSVGGGTTFERASAITVMRLIGVYPPTDGPSGRNLFVRNWLGEKTADRVKIAALQYLAIHGVDSDLSLIEAEVARNKPETSKQAMEAILRIRLRYSRRATAQFALSSQFDGVDEKLLGDVLVGLSELEDDTVLQGLEHRNGTVRLASMRDLKDRGSLTEEIATRFSSDSYAPVRYEALKSLVGFGGDISSDDAKKTLVKPQRRGLWSFSDDLGLGGSDEEGERYYKDYLRSRYLAMTASDLLKAVEDAATFDPLPYLTQCEKSFARHSVELRRDIDDEFKRYFDQKLTRLERILGEESAKNSRSLEESFRKEITRKALDVLCRKSEVEDLPRVRRNLRKGFAGFSEHDIEYLKKRGSWEDINLIVNAYEGRRRGGLMSAFLYEDGTLTAAQAAEAICHLGKGRFDEVLRITMSNELLSAVLKQSRRADFSKLSDDTILSLFFRKAEDVRKAAVTKAVLVLPRTRLGGLLMNYVSSEKSQYYNVIHWLDLGITRSKDDARLTLQRLGLG
jgi:hypothetical protein